ncbi:MAG TPA: hypothetical protein VLT79_11175 [Gemmatimonadales bacterium]|nr:hypothetical protein [Gemmatimonadales bacterium]
MAAEREGRDSQQRDDGFHQRASSQPWVRAAAGVALVQAVVGCAARYDIGLFMGSGIVFDGGPLPLHPTASSVSPSAASTRRD